MADIFDRITKKDIEQVLTSSAMREQFRPEGVPSAEEEALVEPQPFRALSSLVPQTVPELAADTALLGLGGPATKLLGKGAGMLTRLLAPPIAASVAGKFMGQDPMEAAMPSLISTGAVEALAPLGRGAGRLAKQIFRGFEEQRIKQGVKDAVNFATSAGVESPPLKGILPNRQSLINIQDPNIGEKLLKGAFQAVDDDAAKFFTGKRFNFPFVTRKQLPTGQVIGGQEFIQASIPDIANHIKVMKSLAHRSGSGAEAFGFRESVREAEAAYKQILGANPKLLREYESAVTSFDKGLDIIKVLNDSGAVKGSTSGPWLDNVQLGQYLLENVNEFPPVKFPELWKVTSRGGLPGAKDVSLTFGGGRVIFPKPTAAAPAGAVSLPKFARVRRAGEAANLMTGSEAIIPEFLGIRGISELTQ